MKKFLKKHIFLILLVALSIPAVMALFRSGFYGASDDLHVAWLFQMDKVVRAWQIPPRFVPDISFGFGYPLFNFVFPLPFYIGELFHLTGFNFVDSIKIVFGISLIGSAISMYFLLKEVISKNLAFLGSLIYLYTPYRSTDVYVRGAIGESLSFVFLPIVILSIIKKNTPILAVSIAGLILSHNIFSYMFFPFILIFVLLRFSWKSIWGIVLGLLISVYFWLPAIVDSKLMKYETVFNFADHFTTLKQLITPYFGYGASVAGPYDGMSFFIGLENLVVITGGIVFGLLNWKKISTLGKSVFVLGTVIFICSVFMMNFRSSFFWSNIPLLPYFQFPWRFLTTTTFASVLFLIPFDQVKNFRSSVLVAVTVILVVALNFNYFKPHDFLGRTDSYYINRYIPSPSASPEYMQTQEEYLRLPKDTANRPTKVYPLLFGNRDFIYGIIKTDGIYSKISLNLKSDETIYYSKYNFPGWVVKVDGREVEINSGKPFGQISIRVPKGQHILEFEFRETRFKLVLDAISVIALLAVVWLMSVKTKKK